MVCTKHSTVLTKITVNGTIPIHDPHPPFQQDVAVLSAGFIAGDRQAIERLYRAHQQMFMELLERDMVDDEQVEA